MLQPGSVSRVPGDFPRLPPCPELAGNVVPLLDGQKRRIGWLLLTLRASVLARGCGFEQCQIREVVPKIAAITGQKTLGME